MTSYCHFLLTLVDPLRLAALTFVEPEEVKRKQAEACSTLV
jgi:hypothetical protein